MSTYGTMRSKHTPSDREFIDSLSTRDLIKFRDYMYSTDYIRANASDFLDLEWIDIQKLRNFLPHPAPNISLDASNIRLDASSAPAPDPVRVKIEAPNPPERSVPALPVKSEPKPSVLPRLYPAPVQTRIVKQGGKEIIELLDFEAEDGDSDIEVSEVLTLEVRSSSAIPELSGECGETDVSDQPTREVPRSPIVIFEPAAMDIDPVDDYPLEESDTVWQDDIKSMVRTGDFRITQKVNAKRLEYIDDLASAYPVRIGTVFVVDLHNPKHHIINETTKELYTVDHMIRNADNDSWESTSGGGCSKAMVLFAPDEEPIWCRRARSLCRGAFACEDVDPKLLQVVRFDLDTTSRDLVLAAVSDTRRNEATTPEQNAVLFMNRVRSAECGAKVFAGNKCQGGPIMRSKIQDDRSHTIIILSFIETDGKICIVTFVPYLLKRLDDPGVRSFDDDTTYKRVAGELNEWELTIFVKTVLRAASVVRAYINRVSADFFEQLFDELQCVKLQVTGKPMALKRFVRGGNLDVMNADMDAAQILGICRSVMKHNDPVYSGIPSDTPPHKIAPYFVKICWRHAKE
ncbi:hypothetical protein C8J57DRAFT_1600151 [Mycena rebaudengoi]|nr:hypothetical protein C8J57DRAFT_1600151 [Mycena rebaudengoi]